MIWCAKSIQMTIGKLEYVISYHLTLYLRCAWRLSACVCYLDMTTVFKPSGFWEELFTWKGTLLMWKTMMIHDCLHWHSKNGSVFADLQIPAQETEENMWKSTRTLKSKVQVHWFLWGLEDCVGCSRSSRAFLGLPQGFWTEMYINQEYSTNLSGRRRGISTGMALVVRNSWKGNHPNGSLPHHSPEGAPWTKRANSAWSSMRAAAWC